MAFTSQEYTYYLKQGMEQLGAQPVQWEITVEPRVGVGWSDLPLHMTGLCLERDCTSLRVFNCFCFEFYNQRCDF